MDSDSIFADSFSLVTFANAYFAALKHNAGCFCHQSCKLTHNTLHQLYKFWHSLKSLFQNITTNTAIAQNEEISALSNWFRCLMYKTHEFVDFKFEYHVYTVPNSEVSSYNNLNYQTIEI